MQIDATTPNTVPSMGSLERAHSAMNAAFNAIATDRRPDTMARDVHLARDYVREARDELAPAAGHEGPDEAAKAARATLPRLERALQLLEGLAVTPDPEHVAPLLDEIGIAMDHVEAALAAVGWE